MGLVDFIKKNYIIIILLSFFTILYIATIYPGVGGRVNYGDSAKWQFLWAIGGTPHSTGYPLYLMLSALFGNVLLFLEPAIRITSISLVSAIGTLFVLYKISEIFINNKLARILPSYLLGSSYIFWAEATEAEVYTLNALFVSLVIYFSILFHTTKNTKYFLVAIAVYAISFGNHLTMITLLPAMIYIIFATDYKLVFTKKIIAISMLLFLFGASQYLYLLYLSHSGSPYLEFIGRNSSIEHWIEYITGGQFKNHIGGNNTFDLIYFRAMPKFILEFWKDLGWVVVIISFVFIFYQKISKPSYNKVVVFLALIGLFELLNSLSYNIVDIFVYYIPVFLIIVLLLAKTIDLLHSTISEYILVLVLLCTNLFFISNNYKKLMVDSNPRYEEISSFFQSIPKNSTLFIPREGFYRYHGFEALKYAEYVDFSNKKIHHIPQINNKKIKEMYVPASFIEKIPTEKYSLIPFNAGFSLYDFLNKYKNDLIIISGKNESQRGLSPQIKDELLKLGLHFNNLKLRGSYVAIIHKGKLIKEKINNNGAVSIKNSVLEKLGINKVTSAGLKYGNDSKIIFEGENLSLNKRGLNIAVINEDHQIKRYNFDTHKTVQMIEPLFKAIPKEY